MNRIGFSKNWDERDERYNPVSAGLIAHSYFSNTDYS